MAGLVSGFWLAACLALLSLRIPPSFEMVFLDVGQGDGIYICAGGRHFLIDGGSSSEKDLAGYTLLPFLHCRGVSRLDGVILTHDDIDHSGGLLDFLESAEEGRPRIGIGAIYLPDIAEGARGPRYRQIEELAREEGIPVLSISRGMRIRSGRLDMVCLHPEKGAEYEDANAGSTTLCLRYGPFSALLTGDIEGEGEEDLIRFLREGQGEEDLIRFLREGEGEGAAEDPEVFRVTLLKVPHHGSKNATSKRFLETVHADHAVISAGRNNLYGHPHEELLERLSAAGIPFERTDRSGMVTVREEKGSFCMRTFLGDSCRFIFADVIECVSVFGSRAFRQVGIADDIWCSWGTGGRTNEEA